MTTDAGVAVGSGLAVGMGVADGGRMAGAITVRLGGGTAAAVGLARGGGGGVTVRADRSGTGVGEAVLVANSESARASEVAPVTLAASWPMSGVGAARRPGRRS